MSTLQTTNLKHPDSASNQVTFTAGGDINFDSGAVFIDSSNNRVGIGTTGPGRQLQINGDSDTQIRVVASAGGTAGIQFGDTADTVRGGVNYDVSDNSLQLRGYNNSEAMRIDSSGRLLVGATSSSVNASMILQGDSGSQSGASQIYLQRGTAAGLISDGDPLGVINFADSNGGRFARIEAEVDGTESSDDYPGRLVFSTTADGASSPTERMRIMSNGFTKISNDGTYFSTSNTSGIYHEFHSNKNNWTLLLENEGPTVPYGILVRYTASPNNISSQFFVGSTATGDKIQLRSNGGIANFQANNANLCDEREKKNIEALDSTWNCLKEWELTKFHYNEDADTDDKRYGVIAQQVAQYCPEVITDWTKQRAEDAVLDEDGNVVTPAKEEIVRMGVKEQQMMWMAIKALQEAIAKIETLETKVAALEAG